MTDARAERPEPPDGFDPATWWALTRAWDAAPVLVSVVVGPKHVFTYGNAALETLFGGRPLGVPMVEAFPGMDLSALRFFDEVLRTGRTVEVPAREVAIQDLDGGAVVMRYVLSPLAMPDGPVLGVISHAQDVTAQARLALSSKRSHEVAVDLQRALLPAAPPAFPDREVAGRYLAGVPDVEVGGDFWDIVDVGGGQTALGVGDVSGRGVPAAVVMGQARAAMRAMSFAQLGPLDVLGVLDEQLAELVLPKLQESSPAPPRFVTALYGVFSPRTASLRFSCAGHLPPVLRLPGGRTCVADVRPGTPLGLRMGGWLEEEVAFPAGSTVAMFTDGLVESREQEVDDGLRALAAALERFGSATDLDEVAGALIAAMGRDEGHVDDVALLLMRTEDSAYPRGSVDLRVTSLAEVGDARRAGRVLLSELGVAPGLVSDTQHVLDELVANGVEHGGGPADLHLHVTGVRVVIEVTDQAVGRPRPREAGELEERGRGLAVTAGLASRWGVRTGPVGKTVWAEILLPTPLS